MLSSSTLFDNVQSAMVNDSMITRINMNPVGKNMVNVVTIVGG